MVSNIFYFHPYLGKIPNLTKIFQMGWNHQLGNSILFLNMGVSKNRGTPKSSILIGFSIINHPFWKHPHVFCLAPRKNSPRTSKFYWGFSCQSDGSVRWLGDGWRSKASGLLDRIGWCHYTLEDERLEHSNHPWIERKMIWTKPLWLMFHVNLPGCIVVLFVFGKGIIDILFFWGEYVWYVCADMSVYINMIQHVCIVMHMSKFYVKTYGHLHLWRFLGRRLPGQVWGWNVAVQFAHVLLMLFEVLKNLKQATWPSVVKHLRITFKCHTNGVPGRKAYVSKFICFDIVGRYLREN